MVMFEIFCMAILGGVLYRLRGAGVWPSRPWWQIAFAVPYALVALLSGWIVALAVFGATVGMLLTGHASYIDLGSVKKGAANMPSDGKMDEWYGTWIPGRGYWHDFAGLVVSGLLITMPCGIATGGRMGIIIALSGALKAPAYAVAWFVANRTNFNAIAVGESVTGLLLWGSLALVVL